MFKSLSNYLIPKGKIFGLQVSNWFAEFMLFAGSAANAEVLPHDLWEKMRKNDSTQTDKYLTKSYAKIAEHYSHIERKDSEKNIKIWLKGALLELNLTKEKVKVHLLNS